MSAELVCPMCGTRFTPRSAGVCASCPLNGGCELLACCPRCGYEVVNPQASRLVQWVRRIRGRAAPQPEPFSENDDELSNNAFPPSAQ